MRFLWRLIVVLCGTGALAQDPSLGPKARADYEKVESSIALVLEDTLACIQSQAAVLPVTPENERYLIHYRKGYCTLIHAVLAREDSGYRDAAREFEKGIAEWPRAAPKKPAVPLSPTLPILLAISRLKGEEKPDAFRQLARDLNSAAESPECAALAPISVAFCQEIVRMGKLWLGWIAYRNNNLTEAARYLNSFPQTGWTSWIAARQAFEAHRWTESIGLTDQALQVWRNGIPGLARLLGPRPDVARALFDLGTAKFLVKDYKPAIAVFNEALAAQPNNAWALFLRGRAKEIVGLAKPAEQDYELASRTAYASGDSAAATGQAHYYRGVLLFRRKNYAQAEEEFASALSADLADAKPDAAAWWRMSAVAAGSCGASADYLQQALAAVTDFFPKTEAEALLRSCRQQGATRPINDVLGKPNNHAGQFVRCGERQACARSVES